MGRSPKVGAVWATILGTCFAGTAYADILYFKPGATLPTLPPGADVFTYDQSPTKTLTAVRGRIVDIIPNASSASPTQFRFQAAKVLTRGTRSKVLWASKAGKPLFVTVTVTDLDRIDHETDGMQDLRWLFSNRDDLLRRMGSTGISIGWEPFHSYFLAAGGVKARPPALPPIPAPLLTDLQEGWLVRWLKQGPTDSVQREKELAAEIGKLGSGQTLDFLTGMRETEIKTAVHSLLYAATQDKVYPGVYYNDPATKKPTFYPVCRRAVQVLCDLADESNATARELGHRAREAVIQALEAAALGRSDVVDAAGTPARSSDTTANQTLQMRRLEREAVYKQRTGDVASANAAVRRALALAARILSAKPGHAPTLAAKKRLQNLQKTIAATTPAPPSTPASKKPALIASYFPVDPSEIAVVAMEIITGSSSWQVPRFDIASIRNTASALRSPGNEPGVRLVSALMGLANEDPSGRLPRSRDAARDPARAARNVPGYGTVTALEEGLVTSLEHLFAGSSGNAFRREVAERLVEGTDDERDLATRVMSRAGFADSADMAAVVDRLFAVGVMTEEVEGERDDKIRGLRRSLRQQIRRDAVASLMRLASLIDSSDPANRAIGDLVANRAAELMENRAKGFGGDAEERFFESVRSMRGGGSNRPMEDYSAKFEEAFNRHLNNRIRAATRTPEEAKRLRTLLNEHLQN